MLRAVGVAVIAAVACAPGSPVHTGPGAGAHRVVSSNVLRADYAGSGACAPCHAAIAARFATSPMRRMTRDAEDAEISAPFDGRQFAFQGDVATLEVREGRRYVVLDTADGGPSSTERWLVTKVIGGRYREDFVGVEVASTASFSGPIGPERVLPISWLRFDQTFRYKGYSVFTPERPGLRAGAKWRTTCIFCHNTVPYLSTVLDELIGDDAPVFQGSVSTELPKSRELAFEITDLDALRHALSRELEVLEAPLPANAEMRELLSHTAIATRKHFDERHLVEIGIGCESCHGGAKEHVARPDVHPTFEPVSSVFAVKSAGAPLGAAEAENRACARCHTVLFSQYSFTWEGRQRSVSPGGSSMNSGEARDFLLGACAKAMRCSTCHDPHAEDERAHLESLGTRAGNAVCTTCHEEKREDAAVRAHTHHDPAGTGGACLSCHMPKKNLGLEYRLVRYHRIGSPTDEERALADRPLECATCHADKTVLELVVPMERWWGKRFDRKELRELYGADLGVNALRATLARGKPHERATAVGIAGDARAAFLADAVLGELGNEYPLVRFWTKHALEAIFQEKMPIDAHLPAKELHGRGREWLAERVAARGR